MIHRVCEQDPRGTAQRRADALGALAAGATQLSCSCDSPHCPTRGDADPRAQAVVIHVLAESATLTARPDPQTSGENNPARTPPRCQPVPPAPPGVMLGGRVLPAPMLAELAAHGAKGAAGERARRRGPAGVSALDHAVRVHPHARHDLPVARLRPARPVHRHRPHHALSGRPDPPVEQQVLLPKTPSIEDIPVRAGRLERPPTPRRHPHRDLPHRAHLHHPPRLSPLLPDLPHHHRRPAPTTPTRPPPAAP